MSFEKNADDLSGGQSPDQPQQVEATPVGQMPPDDDPTAIILRRALANAATSVEPSTDALRLIQARTGEIRRISDPQAVPPATSLGDSAPAVAVRRAPSWRRRWAPLAAAAAVIAVGLLGGGLLGRGMRESPSTTAVGTHASVASPGTAAPTSQPVPTTDLGASGSATASGPATSPATGEGGPNASSSADTGRTVPVYWVAASRTRLWLYREFQPSVTGAASVEAAVRTLLENRPMDEDFDSLWRSASHLSVRTSPDGITIDLSPDAFRATREAVKLTPPGSADFWTEMASASVQQLVWTATAAYGRGDAVPVRILVDGATGYQAWGSVELGGPMVRDPQSRAPIWVIEPQDGASVAGPEVTITGSGYAFEGTISWEITRGGSVIDSGVVTTRGDGVPGDFSITARLEPGRYQVTAYQADASDGESAEGARQFADTKSFEVR